MILDLKINLLTMYYEILLSEYFQQHSSKFLNWSRSHYLIVERKKNFFLFVLYCIV